MRYLCGSRRGTAELAALEVRPEQQIILLTNRLPLKGFERHVPGYPRYTYDGDPAEGSTTLVITGVTLTEDGEYQCQVGPTNASPPIWAAANVTVLQPSPPIPTHSSPPTLPFPRTPLCPFAPPLPSTHNSLPPTPTSPPILYPHPLPTILIPSTPSTPQYSSSLPTLPLPFIQPHPILPPTPTYHFPLPPHSILPPTFPHPTLPPTLTFNSPSSLFPLPPPLPFPPLSPPPPPIPHPYLPHSHPILPSSPPTLPFPPLLPPLPFLHLPSPFPTLSPLPHPPFLPHTHSPPPSSPPTPPPETKKKGGRSRSPAEGTWSRRRVAPTSITIVGLGRWAEVQVAAGTSLTLECLVADARPAPKAEWYRGGLLVDPGGPDRGVDPAARRWSLRSQLEVTAQPEDDGRDFSWPGPPPHPRRLPHRPHGLHHAVGFARIRDRFVLSSKVIELGVLSLSLGGGVGEIR
ncbi:hypothetical protein C7M84_020455 [Penaeus vannamei]|uniref:Ig-like domain-containing protein n=1 Tax=Penaeus vannamei TaxID=6689 RepID=A0A423SC63_PENVA|nr:hypothetical protein C7M84_020455 [Penaeus vannamei]